MWRADYTRPSRRIQHLVDLFYRACGQVAKQASTGRYGASR
jgi:hypothetical protein